MNLYFSRKFTYSSYEDHVKYAQKTRENHECRNTLTLQFTLMKHCFVVF